MAFRKPVEPLEAIRLESSTRPVPVLRGSHRSVGGYNQDLRSRERSRLGICWPKVTHWCRGKATTHLHTDACRLNAQTLEEKSSSILVSFDPIRKERSRLIHTLRKFGGDHRPSSLHGFQRSRVFIEENLRVPQGKRKPRLE